MANTFADGTQREHFMPKVQRELMKRSVAVGISEVFTGPDRVIHNPYASVPVSSDGTVSSPSYNVSDYQKTDDILTVNRRADISEHIDHIEKLQSNYDEAMQRAEVQAKAVKDRIDQYMLNLPVSLSGVDDIDDGDFAGTAGNPKVSSSSNIDEIANTIVEQVSLNDGATDRGMFWVVSPYELTDITLFMQNNGFSVTDAAIRNGFTGGNFSGLDIFVSNNLTHTAVLGLATNPTDGDTITLKVPGNGSGRETVTITFVATLSGGAGEVHIASTVDITRANLAEFLNAYGANDEAEAIDTGYAALSQAGQDALNRANLTATNDNAADTLTINVRGTLSVSETLTDGADAWGTVGRHTVAGVYESMFVALPADGMTYNKKEVGQKHGMELVTAQIYNGTIWERRKGEVFDVYLA